MKISKPSGPALILATIIALLGSTVGAQESVRLPDLGGGTLRVLSPEQERTFARDFERYMRAHNLLVEDPLIRDYFEDMGFRLVSVSSRPSAEFHFFVMRDPSINAFASVSGVIGLNAGLILMAHDESEVAGVVAHEIAHVTQDHLARSMEAAQQVSLPMMIATLGLAVAAGMAGAGGDAPGAVLMSGMGLAQQMQINHTRQAEAEADRVGIGLLARAGYDPHGMARFFERLNAHSRIMGSGPPEYLRTHPLTVNRTAEARSRADQFNVAEPRDSIDFHFAQARLRVLMSQSAQSAEDWFRVRLERGERPAEAMRYGLVLSQIRARQFARASIEMDRLINDFPDHQLIKLLEAELLLAAGDPAQAVERLAALYQDFPGSRMVTRQYAEALMHDGSAEQAARAGEVIRRHLRRFPNDLRMTELLAQASNRSGEPVRAIEATAESYYLRGGITAAIEQLELAERRDDLDYYQRARISARLNELRGEQVRMMSRRP
ncbi:MAG: M48 family metalloprotease [Wenzhouxiangella sp.]